MKNENNYKWTIFFLIKNVEEEYSSSTITMINEIKGSNISEDVSVVLCLNCLVLTIIEIDPAYENKHGLCDHDKTTVFYKIVPRSDSGSEGSLKLLEDDPTFNIKEQSSVQNFFKEKILLGNKADRYILFTWDHGAAFGIFRDFQNSAGIVANKMKFQDVFLTFKFRDTLNNIDIPDEKKKKINGELHSEAFDMLTMDELRDAIQWAFGNKKIDIVIMLNCFMQFFDAGYALRNCVKYLIAAEGLMNIMEGHGYDYNAILDRITKNTSISSKRLSRYVVRTFEDKYYRTKDGTEKTVITANSLQYYVRISALIDRLSVWLTKKLEKNAEIIQQTVNVTEPFTTDYYLVDLVSFLKILKKRIHTLSLLILYYRFLRIVKLAIISRFVSDDLKRAIEGQIVLPAGFSVFFPGNSFINNAFYSNYILEDSEEATEFSMYHKWDNFIKHYLQKIDNLLN